MENDTYRSINSPGESLYKVKGSKHFGYAFRVNNEDDIKLRLEQVKKEHHSARHHCYAWKLGMGEDNFRANDDGEPSNSAGKPIYGAILSADLTNILIVVVRYFGGTKLGVGGLIDAYRTAAKMAIEEANIVEEKLQTYFKISFPYPQMGAVMSAMKDMDLPVNEPIFEMHCTLSTQIRQANAQELEERFNDLDQVVAERIEY
ncbi:MAG: IMPACT family protein [Flavobacteriales bacterium]